MTDINAALGLSQLSRLTDFIRRRREITCVYDAAFADLPVQSPWQHRDTESSWHLYVIRVAAEQHRAVFDALRDAGIGVNLHYIPVYLQPYYRALGFSQGLCPEAEAYAKEAISLPMFPTMTADQQDRVIEEVRRAVSA